MVTSLVPTTFAIYKMPWPRSISSKASKVTLFAFIRGLKEPPRFLDNLNICDVIQFENDPNSHECPCSAEPTGGNIKNYRTCVRRRRQKSSVNGEFSNARQDIQYE